MRRCKEIWKKYESIFVLTGFVCVIIIIVLLWNFWYNRDMPYKSLELDGENVKCIVVVNKTKRKTWTVTDENEIGEILKYFNKLKVREFNTYEKHGGKKYSTARSSKMYYDLIFYSDTLPTEENILFDLHIPQGETLQINGESRIVRQEGKSIYNERGSFFKDEADEGNDE